MVSCSLMRFFTGGAARLWALLPLPLSCATLTLTAALGCASGGKEFSGPLPSPDGEMFVKQVYPVLLRDCAHVGCHGMPERFFQLYGPGRARIPRAEMNPATAMEVKFTDPANLDEVLHSYQRALDMLATADNVEETLLLLKPLEAKAGGQGHKGVDDLGRNVFASKQDASWQVLLKWAKSKGSPPTAQQVSALNEAAAAGQLNPEATQ